jgi:cytochrome P450
MTRTDINYFDPTGHHLHEANSRLLTMGPAARVALPGNVVAWSVTRQEVIQRLAADPRVSRDAARHWPGLTDLPGDWPLMPFLASPTVLNAYGSDHRRLRDIMEHAFVRERLDIMRSNLEKRLARRLPELGTPGSGQVIDARGRYARVIAAEAICDLFGVPEDDWDAAKQAMAAIVEPPPDPAEAAARLEGTMGFLDALLRAKRQSPGDDMPTVLNEAREVNAEERVLALAVTIAGGVPATTELLANAIANLLTHPDQRSAVTSGGVSWAEVIEETLRVDGPVQHMPLRYAVEDIDLGEGVVISRGEPILMGFGAGGRDPSVHGASAAEFDIRRAEKAHMSFGFGVHHCIGAPLARTEAAVALPALFDYFPHLELAEPVSTLPPLPTFIFHGRVRLPVRL